MEIRQLRYFLAVVEMGSISAAARRFGMAQPSLSARIKGLEEEIGQQLLLRKPRGVEVTEAGREVMGYARRMVAEMDGLKGVMENRENLREGSVVFGMIPTLSALVVEKVLGPFCREYPGVRIRAVEGKTQDMIRAVVAGKIEFAITSDVTPAERKKWALHTKELFKEPLMLAMPAGHRLARGREPKVKDLAGEELLHLKDGHCLGEQTLEVCRTVAHQSTMQCDQVETVVAMVGEGFGCALIPQSASRLPHAKSVVVRNFDTPRPTRSVMLLKRRGVKLSAAGQRLMEMVTG